MTLPRLITLQKAHFLYLALVVLVVLPVVLAIVFSPVLGNYWCKQFDVPEYERTFGFKLGTFELPDREGGTYSATGIATVNSAGAFARAGIRPGDLPRMHHGWASFCGSLAAAADGYESTLDVINVDDLRAGRRDARREVTLRPATQ